MNLVTGTLILMSAVLGAWCTHRLALLESVGAVRASAAATLAFVFMSGHLAESISLQDQLSLLQASFFGASFIGMSDPKKLGEKQILLASLVFSLLFLFAFPYFRHLGGGLGATAFASSLIVYGFSKTLL